LNHPVFQPALNTLHLFYSGHSISVCGERKTIWVGEVLVLHSGEVEDWSVMGCCAEWAVSDCRVFPTKLLLSSSRFGKF